MNQGSRRRILLNGRNSAHETDNTSSNKSNRDSVVGSGYKTSTSHSLADRCKMSPASGTPLGYVRAM